MCACTASFAMIGFLVTDGAGAPIAVDEVILTIEPSGEALKVEQSLPFPGQVIVADDSSEVKKKISPKGTTVRAVIRVGSSSKTVDTVVGVDEPCGCHVQKLSGPDVVKFE